MSILKFMNMFHIVSFVDSYFLLKKGQITILVVKNVSRILYARVGVRTEDISPNKKIVSRCEIRRLNIKIAIRFTSVPFIILAS
jgi:hypothetical protein